MQVLGRIALTSVLLTACSRPQAESDPPVVAEEPSPVQAATARDVAYVLSPIMRDGDLAALAVELRFAADPSGTTRLQLPERWASEQTLWKYVRALEIDGAESVREDGPAARVIEAKSNTPITVRYEVVSAYDHEPDASDGQPFAPIVRPTWFYGFGEAIFATPEGRDSAKATFRWDSAGTELGFVSDLQQFGPDGGAVHEIRDSIILGGADTHVYRERIGDAEIRVGMRGAFAFPDAKFVSLAKSIITTEREFWDDHGEPFTIVLAPLLALEGRRSLGGTGRSDGFTILMSEDAPLEALRHLIAHEYFHTWNPSRLGGQGPDDDEMNGKWFSEGFTEFYTWRLLLRSGLFSVEDFIAAWNDALLEYATSPAIDAPLSRVREEYWSDPAVGRLPYRQGPLLAAIWEKRLREDTQGERSLDDVLHAMRKTLQKASDPSAVEDAATTFRAAYANAGGRSLHADVAHFIESGNPIRLPSDAFGSCVRVVDKERPTFDRGWDVEATRAADNVVTGLRSQSPAHKAGLRDGMKLIRRLEGSTGDATAKYVLEVLDGTRTRKISFFPRGAGRLRLQQLELAKGVDDEACRISLGGAGATAP